MPEYEASTYGDRIAETYDQRPEIPKDAEEATAFLAATAGSGPVLELGIGTGRLAIPLLERGLKVHGIDASAAMVARLRAKPRGTEIPVTIGNFAEVPIDGAFSLTFVAFNTFFALLTQEDQLRCFSGVAAHLRPGGAFVIEAFVPDLTRFDRGQRVDALQVGTDLLQFDASTHDLLNQRIFAQHVRLSQSGIDLYPVQLRYCWPSELDLMGRLAGLHLESRWGGWRQEPFTAASGRHVSVYRAAL